AFAHGVLLIVQGRPEPEMGRVDAELVIATWTIVQHLHVHRNGARDDHPTDPIGTFTPRAPLPIGLGYPKRSIPPAGATRPVPTTPRTGAAMRAQRHLDPEPRDEEVWIHHLLDLQVLAATRHGRIAPMHDHVHDALRVSDVCPA